MKKVRINKGQNDIGVNISIINNKASIHLYHDIPAYVISGVSKDNPVIICEGKGYLIRRSDTDDNIMIPVYYCKEADGTIISPNNAQQFYKLIYHSLHLFCDCDDNTGHLKFYNRYGVNNINLKIYL